MTAPTQPEVSLKGFLLRTLLWLPLAFCFWFLWAGLFVAPVTMLIDAFLTSFGAGKFPAVYQNGFHVEVEVLMEVPEALRTGAGQAIVTIPVNPMIYGYGLPLLAGLVISTPLRRRIRALQIGVGWLTVGLTQAWGVFWDLLQTLQFQMGPEGQAVVADLGLDANAIALAYQFGYLILPGVVPVVLWLVMNRRFIESQVPQIRGLNRPA